MTGPRGPGRRSSAPRSSALPSSAPRSSEVPSSGRRFAGARSSALRSSALRSSAPRSSGQRFAGSAQRSAGSGGRSAGPVEGVAAVGVAAGWVVPATGAARPVGAAAAPTARAASGAGAGPGRLRRRSRPGSTRSWRDRPGRSSTDRQQRQPPALQALPQPDHRRSAWPRSPWGQDQSPGDRRPDENDRSPVNDAPCEGPLSPFARFHGCNTTLCGIGVGPLTESLQFGDDPVLARSRSSLRVVIADRCGPRPPAARVTGAVPSRHHDHDSPGNTSAARGARRHLV